MVGGQPSRWCKQWHGLAAIVHRKTAVSAKTTEDFGRHMKTSETKCIRRGHGKKKTSHLYHQLRLGNRSLQANDHVFVSSNRRLVAVKACETLAFFSPDAQ